MPTLNHHPISTDAIRPFPIIADAGFLKHNLLKLTIMENVLY